MKLGKATLAVLMMTWVAHDALADVWQDLSGYHYGDERVVPSEVETLIADSPRDQHDKIEDGLIRVIADANATEDAKAFSCRMLQQVGTEKSIAVLASLLSHERLSHYARLALERMPYPKAGAALRDALPKVPGKLKVGILGSIGVRRDEAAVDAVAEWTKRDDVDVVAAALEALGAIGTPSAGVLLSGVPVPQSLAGAKHDAMIACAERLAGAGAARDAAALLRAVMTDSSSSQVARAAALHVLHDSDADAAISAFVELFKAPDGYARRAALTCVGECPGEPLTRAAAGVLPELPPTRQAELLDLLARRGDAAALTAVKRCLDSATDSAVREAALVAVSQLGGVDEVDMLLSRLVDGEASAATVLIGMTGDGVEERLVRALQVPVLQEGALVVLRDRVIPSAAGTLVALTKDKNAEVRKGAWACLRATAATAQLGGLLQVLNGIQDQAERRLAEAALKEVFAEVADDSKSMAIAAPYFKKGEEPMKLFVLDVAAISGSPAALDLVKEALKEQDKTIQGRALRALAAWSNSSAAPELLELAKSAATELDRLLALRGYIKVADSERRRDEKLEMYKAATALCARPDELRMVISGLSRERHMDALLQLVDLLDKEGVKDEAEKAVADMCWNLRRQNPAEVAPIAKRLVENSANKQIVDSAQRTYDETRGKK